MRNADQAKLYSELSGSEFVEGNVLNLVILYSLSFSGATIDGNSIPTQPSLMTACQGCDAVISVHGMKPPRFSKVIDFSRHPRHDWTHPYNVNFIGTRNIIEAMQAANVSKLVRITGATVGAPVLLNPLKVLFATLLSMSARWHEESEVLIRASGLDYTVLRPTGIKDTGEAAKTGKRLVLLQGDEYAAGNVILLLAAFSSISASPSFSSRPFLCLSVLSFAFIAFFFFSFYIFLLPLYAI